MATILVADNEYDIRALLAKFLTIAGHEVIEAEDGKAAVEQAINKQPDVIILDISMPTMSGLEALEELRSNSATRNLPVILLTAYTVVSTPPSRENYGPTYHMTKPWRRGALERLVRTAIRRR